ncbi:MAG TPA: OmpH family outer membrane protein, partial [Thermoguttaceae bacterium]|nr:OmpH family outer membrane protein [Thermoguttaceae bacterium]
SESEDTFNEDDDISAKLEMLLFPFPGSISPMNASSLKFEPLVRTGSKTGTVDYDRMFQRTMFGGQGGLDPRRPMRPTNTSYVLAAHIQGKLAADKPMADEGEGAEMPALDEHAGHDHAPGEGHPETIPADMLTDMADVAAEDLTGAAPSDGEINVVLVADIDMFHRQFFMLRESGDNPEAGVDFNFDNVTFVLNILDVLADDPRFVEIRKRRPKHRTLARVDEFKKNASQRNSEAREKLEDELDEAQNQMQTDLNNSMEKLREDMQKKQIDDQEIGRRFALALTDGQRRMQQKVDQLQRKNNRELKEIEKQQDREIRRVQDRYKMLAVLLPPIPPLLLALMVFFTRRGREREGVARSRLR